MFTLKNVTLYLAGQMHVASTGPVTGLVCGWTSQPLDYSRADLEPGHRAASETAVGSKASRPVTGATVIPPRSLERRDWLQDYEQGELELRLRELGLLLLCSEGQRDRV